MQKITSYEEYEGLIRALKASAGRLNNNNYHFEQDLRDWIAAGTFSFRQCGNILAFFHENPEYYDLIYYLPAAPEDGFDLTGVDKPVLISIVFNRQSDKLAQAQEYWQGQGFGFYKASRHMTIDVTDQPAPKEIIRPASTYRQAEEFAGLIKSSFYSYGDGVPDADEVWQAIREGRVLYCLAQPENEIAGFMRTGAPTGNHTDNMNITVKPRFKGRGYSRQIIQGFCVWCRERGIQYMTLWVNRGNTVAERLYESMGYEYSGKESVQYLYEPAGKIKEETK